MPKRTFTIGRGEPLFDLVSYGRGGPAGGRTFSPAQIDQIRRTVHRAPEVVVKVLARNSNDLKAVQRHLDYIGRYGKLELETDDGERLKGTVGKAVAEDWDLDIDETRRQSELGALRTARPPKILHKLIFSMPAGTPPEKVLAAVRNFAREEFWGQHRYALALHTDEPQPHVHLVLKAISEQGVRLNIKKATLRHWRCEFARNLRLLGVTANATERAVRGQSQKARKDGIYRASLRGESTYVRAQSEAVAPELLRVSVHSERASERLVETRNQVAQGWRGLASRLLMDGQRELAADVERFVRGMPPAWTEQQWTAHQIRRRLSQVPEPRMTR